MARYQIVVGTTEPQDFKLLDNDAEKDRTGIDVAIVFRTAGLSAAKVTALAGVSVAWLDQTAGTVRVSGIGGLPLGTYLPRYTLTDSGGKVGYVPSQFASDQWDIVLR